MPPRTRFVFKTLTMCSHGAWQDAEGVLRPTGERRDVARTASEGFRPIQLDRRGHSVIHLSGVPTVTSQHGRTEPAVSTGVSTSEEHCAGGGCVSQGYLLAPPIVLQKRKSRTQNCKKNMATNMIECVKSPAPLDTAMSLPDGAKLRIVPAYILHKSLFGSSLPRWMPLAGQ